MKDRETNRIFAAYLQATGQQKTILEYQLITLLTQHARAVCWTELRQKRPDVVQDALIRCFRAMRKFRGDSQFSTWFHRIVVNCCKTTLTRELKQGKRELGLEEIDELRAPEPPPEVSEEAMRKHLNKTDLMFLNLKLQGVSDNELGERFGLSPAGVRTKWHRLKRKLRAVYKGA